MNRKEVVLILTGPTASGKTQLSLNIARTIPTEILSADSRQVYKHLSIGTAKPTDRERAMVRHHFIDVIEPDESWNAGLFADRARRTIKQIFERGKIPFVVGGSGLYVHALVYGIADIPLVDKELRSTLKEKYINEGLTSVIEELKEHDPDALSKIDIRNPRRVLRALEIYYSTGLSRNELEKQSNVPLEYPVLWFGLRWDRKALYERIEQRVDTMISRGLIKEVETLRASGYHRHLNALQSVGYVEVLDYLEGKVDKEEMILKIKQNTRRFAKRQMTWFNREKKIKWIDIQCEEDLERAAQGIIDEYYRYSRQNP